MFMLCSNHSGSVMPMFAMPGIRTFSLVTGRDSQRVSCDAYGVFVGGVALLKRDSAGERDGWWRVRPLIELNDELTVRYQLPIDIATKANALALIASAFNRNDLAMAAIATVQMQFPDPPPLTKSAESADEITRRAVALFRSPLLKADPDWDAKHPRTGAPPNPGWFASVPKEPKLPEGVAEARGWPLLHVNKLARQFVKRIIGLVERNTGRLLLVSLEWNPAIDAFIAVFTPVELNGGEDRLTAQLKAALDPPKSLDELQRGPTENILGYEKHHIVEQNPENLEKIVVEKFGRARLNDPTNLANVARFPHEDITGDYNRTLAGPGSPTVRDLVDQLSFEQQREIGLMFMRKHGVLK
jgi:hypothetical protein